MNHFVRLLFFTDRNKTNKVSGFKSLPVEPGRGGNLRRIFNQSLRAVCFVSVFSAQLSYAYLEFTVAKRCENPNQACTYNGLLASYYLDTNPSFTLDTRQVVRWRAWRRGGTADGNRFYLSHTGINALDILVADQLPANNSFGEVDLQPGTYFIAINTFEMGHGDYTIEYNRVADISVAPTPIDFGNFDVGDPPSLNHTVTINLAGDDVDVNVTSAVSSDPLFSVSGFTPGPLSASGTTSKTLAVRFNPSTVGSHDATLTISATGPSGSQIPSKTVDLHADVAPLVPDIECVSQGATPQIDALVTNSTNFNISFRNDGNAPLRVSGLVLSNNPGGVFTLTSPTMPFNVAPSTDRALSIQYNPPPDAERIDEGEITITSDDPDDPNLTCSFTARSHHPQPDMQIADLTLNFHDVELGFTYTKAIIVRNIGDAPLVFDLSLVDDTDPDLAQWSEHPENVMGATLAPGTETLFRYRFTPLNVGTFTFQVEAHGYDNFVALPYDLVSTITLTGQGINPVPMDNVLVLDRSVSMDAALGSRTKIDALQRAASLYNDLLRPNPIDGSGDKLGLVRYNHTNEDYLPLDFINAATNASPDGVLAPEAIADGTRLQPRGTTGIGGAMQRAAEMLGPVNLDRKQIMVVMTDGIENEAPYVAEVLPGIESGNSHLMIYSLGLGHPGEFDEALLQNITNLGNGYHQVSHDLTGTDIFSVEEFYFKIWSNAAGASLIVDPTTAANISPGGPIEINHARVVTSDRFAAFMVLEDPALQSFYTLELKDPNGNIMIPGSGIGGIPIQVLRKAGYTVYKIIFPEISQANQYVGNWVLRLRPTGKWNPKDSLRYRDYQNNSDEYIQPQNGLVPIGFGAAVRSDYKMEVEVTANNFQRGANITLIAKFTDRGWHSRGDVNVRTTRPDNLEAWVHLYDDGSHNDALASDGIYTNVYTNTAPVGTYEFFFDGIGHNERGELVPRQDTRYVTLSSAPPLGGSGPGNGAGDRCFPCWMHWLTVVLLVVIIWIILWCCLKMKR